MSQIFEELERRGLIAQMTHPEKIREKLDNEKVVFYIGFEDLNAYLSVCSLSILIG